MTQATIIRPLAPALTMTALSAAALLTGLVLTAMLRQLLLGGRPFPSTQTLCRTPHLATIVPAIPLGAVVLLRPKGDRPHRLPAASGPP